MKSNKYLMLLLGGAFLFGTTSCEDKLDIPQRGVLDYESYYQTDEQAEAAADALYIQLKNTYYNYTMLKNTMSDDVWAGGGGRNDNAELEGCNEFSFGSDQSFVGGVWESYYQIIYKANVIMGHVTPDTPAKEKAIAEAKFFRAFAYFDLVSMWGDVPKVDHELGPDEYQIARSPKAEIYALIEQDLTEAIASGKLEEKSSVNDKNTWRVTKQLAQAILGKALLWQGKNAEAAKAFAEVINSGKYELFQGGYDQMLMAENDYNCESMLESNRILDMSNAFAEFGFYNVMNHWRTDKMNSSSMPALGIQETGWGFCVPQGALYDAFVAEEGVDGYRLNGTFKTTKQMNDMGFYVVTSLVNEGVWMWKRRFTYAESAMSFWISYANFRWMRYAEVLLLAAEANLAAGNQAEADRCLNLVRERAKLPHKTATLDAIKLEKRLELCCEYTRFQDLLRWKEAEKYMANQGSYTPILYADGTIEKKVYNTDPSRYGFKERHNLLPIPAKEMRLNPNMEQNPGW